MALSEMATCIAAIAASIAAITATFSFLLQLFLYWESRRTKVDVVVDASRDKNNISVAIVCRNQPVILQQVGIEEAIFWINKPFFDLSSSEPENWTIKLSTMFDVLSPKTVKTYENVLPLGSKTQLTSGSRYRVYACISGGRKFHSRTFVH